MWKSLNYIQILFTFCCAMAMGTLFDQVGKSLTKLNPTIPNDVKEESKMDTAQVARFHNYTGETHTVTTEDGYILTLFRIKNPRVCSNGKIVFLQHGLFCDSSSWMLNLPGQSPAYVFADEGHDVWLGNHRGNAYSRKHVKYDSNKSEFWDFTLDDLAEFDLPAMIYYAKNTSRSETLHYVGHSQGTTIMLMALLIKPIFEQEFSSIHFYTPVVQLQHSSSLYVLVANAAYEQFRKFRKTEFEARSEPFVVICGQTFLTNACENVFHLLFGPSENQINETRLPIFFENYLSGAGTGQLAHYGQFYRTDEFRRFDYGSSIENQNKYGQNEPPEYDLGKIEYKHFYFYSSDNDNLADPEDVKILCDILGSRVKRLFRLKSTDGIFNHLDYVRSINANRLVYRHTLEIIKSYDDPNSEYKNTCHE